MYIRFDYWTNFGGYLASFDGLIPTVLDIIQCVKSAIQNVDKK